MKKITPQSLLMCLFCLYGNWIMAQGSFDYSDVLGKSIEFYDGQICGPQPAWSRATWRNDCHMNDGSDVGKNLTGGWHDAGDHTKFNYVSAQATRVLAWSYLDYQNAFDNTGNKTHLLNHLRLSGDFMIKLHPSANVFHAQIGRAKTGSNPEHNEWVAPSLQSPSIDRSTITINTSNPGTHMAASNAAAFASLSMVFENNDASYSATLLQHAKDLFDFADQYRGSHYDLLGSPEPYPMNDFDDDLFIAAVWLYKATNDNQYLTRAETEYNKVSNNTGWMMHYRDHAYEGYLLMAEITGEQKYYTSAENWLDNEIDNAPRSNGGLYYRSDFLPASLAQSMAFAAYFYAELRGSGFSKYNKYRNFAFDQIDYVLGDNPRNSSYVVGYGNNPTTITHHRGASGVPQNSTAPDTHVHVGSLAGGPRQDDSFNEVRTDVKSTEPAISQQAFFVGMAAMMVKETGGANPGTEGSIEIENSFSVFNEAGSNNTVAPDPNNPGASNGQYVRLFDTNDELSTTFTVGEAGDYKIDLRVRTGEQSSNSTNNLAGQYEVRINGTVRSFNFVSGSASALDGDTYWGLISRTQNLSAGTHTIRIKAKTNWLKADRLDFAKVTAPGFEDLVIAVSAPTSITQGETVTIQVEYSASTDRDLVVLLQRDGNPDFQGFESVKTDVGEGTETLNINLQVPSDLPVGNDLYQFQTYLTTNGGGFGDKLSNIRKFDVDAVAASSGGTIKIRAKGDCGTETMQLRVDGTTVKTWNNVSTSYATYNYDGFTSGEVRVHFTNDGGGGCDRNLEVDWIEVCGNRLQTETEATETSNCCAFDADKLYTNGNFNFGNQDCGGSSTNTITVRARGVNGEEVFELLLDDVKYGDQKQVTTNYVDYVFENVPSGSTNIKVDFVNDVAGRDLRIDYIKINNSTLQAENMATNTGVWQNNSCGGSNSEWLHCSGYINFGNRNIGSTSLTTSLEQETLIPGAAIQVFPNPVNNGFLKVQSNNASELQLFDLLGRQVFFKTGLKAGISEINLESVNAGLYILKVTDEVTKDTHTSKLVIE